MFIVKVHLAKQLVYMHSTLIPRNKYSNKHNTIRIPNGWRRTSWLFTRMTEELNQALAQNNTS